MNALIIEAPRTGYSPDQIRKTLTVAELKDILDNFDDDMPIYFSHDNGYTYGELLEENMEEREIEE